MKDKSSTDYMVEFMRKYPEVAKDSLLRSLCIKIREEGVKEGEKNKRRKKQ